MEKKLAPLVLFTYKRLETLQRAVACLQANYLASETDLFVFCDGAKKAEDEEKVNQVQQFCDRITGFRKVVVNKSAVNKGLANSVKKGVSEVLRQYDRAIVLEDDLETTPNFLDFMNQSLEDYKNNQRVFSVSGYTFPIKPGNYAYDAYFTKRGLSWGWATWADRWAMVDWDALHKIDAEGWKKARSLGSDLVSLIKKVRAQTNDSWAIPWIFNQCLHDLYSIYPVTSKVRNIGFGPDATHTFKSQHRFATSLDPSEQRHFRMPEKVSLHQPLMRQYNLRVSYFYRGYALLLFYFKKIFGGNQQAIEQEVKVAS